MKARTTLLLAAAFAFGLVAVTAETSAWAKPKSQTRATPTAGKKSRVAQGQKSAAKKRTTKKSRKTQKGAKKVKIKRLTFDRGDELEGGVGGPNTDTVSARVELSHSSLIRLRHDFLPEIHKSAESL